MPMSFLRSDLPPRAPGNYRSRMSIPLLVVLGVRRDGQKVVLVIKNMGGKSGSR